MRSLRRMIAPALPIVLSLACLTVTVAGLLPHFHDASDSGHASSSSCVFHQAASAMLAIVSAESPSPETPVFLWSLSLPGDAASYRAYVLRNGLRGPPALTRPF